MLTFYIKELCKIENTHNKILIMKKNLIILITFFSAITTMAQTSTNPSIQEDKTIEKEIDKIINKMSLDEKIGQMTELVIDVIGKTDAKGEFQLDDVAMDSIFGKYKIGSILNAPNTIAQSPKKWQELIQKIQKKSLKLIGIPCIYGLDQNHGTTYTIGGTLFPQNISAAASFNRNIPYEAARITAYETRAGSCPWTYSPTVDLGRDPRWPRMWENFGEDSYVNSEMGSAAVRGFQGDNPNHIDKQHVAVSLKHYMGYSVPFTGKDRTPAIISQQDLREKHFAPFLACVKNGALSVMANSGSVNGLPVHANYELLTQWLKKDLNWDGVLVTDWADINNLYTREKICLNKKEAIKLAINAGIDMAMEPYNADFCPLLKELVENGDVTMDRINDATRRVLRMKYRLGLFDSPITKLKDYPLFGSKEHANIALHAAEECMVLLKNNDNILPIAKGKKIFVTGPNANSMRCIDGGWSYTWQGHLANQFTSSYNTILEAVKQKFGNDNVSYFSGVSYKENGAYWEENIPEIDKAVTAAKDADYIIACIGENSYCEIPGNLTDLTLSNNQINLVKALSQTGKPIILILNEGRPRIINSIEPLATAVIDAILPGNYGGDALANLLAGDVNFSGKLPFTYPKEINSLINYDYKVSEEVDKMQGAYDYNAVVSAQWAFGFGKSYTSFKYSNLKVDKNNFKNGDIITFNIDVTNTGDRAGKESILLFSSDLVASVTPDNRRLRAFEKIELQPGETKTVTLKIKASDLAFVGHDGKWILEKGTFKIQIGNQITNINCVETNKWSTPNI